jgi:type IV pilus assembly protein PilE
MKSRGRPFGYRTAIGFTLIELMIVVLIVAILASIAVPSYQAYVVRANRTAAKSCMLEFAQSLERFYTTNMTYVGAVPTSGCTSEGGLNNNYTITVATPTQLTYTITATPINGQLSRDTTCATLTLDQAGTRTPTTASCW